MRQTKIWLDYGQKELDAEYNNQRTVENYDGIMREWTQASEHARANSELRADLAYGSHARDRIDFYHAKGVSPAIIFFHGGFWRSFDKTGLAFLAPAFNAAGISIALPNYPLAPEAEMTTIVQHARQAVTWVIEHATDLKIDRTNLWLAGHSAGAHLAVMAAAGEDPSIAGCCAISGIYDLRPIQLSYLNETLHLSDAEVMSCSPTNFEIRVPRLIVAVGERETKEFRRQTAELTGRIRARGHTCWDMLLPDTNHYDAVRALARPNDPFFRDFSSAVLRKNLMYP